MTMARNVNDLNPWQGLNTAQIALLTHAQKEPRFSQLNKADGYRAVGDDFSRRTAMLLAGNDLLGALDSAQIATACYAIANGLEHRHAQTAQRLLEIRAQEEANPGGILVQIPGHKRRKRVYPGDPLHPATRG